jgi:hypothetical protein
LPHAFSSTHTEAPHLPRVLLGFCFHLSQTWSFPRPAGADLFQNLGLFQDLFGLFQDLFGLFQGLDLDLPKPRPFPRYFQNCKLKNKTAQRAKQLQDIDIDIDFDWVQKPINMLSRNESIFQINMLSRKISIKNIDLQVDQANQYLRASKY